MTIKRPRMKKKIIITTPYYPPYIGGIEIHVKNLARRLKKRGYYIKIITSVGKDNKIKIKTISCLKIPYSPIPLFFPRIKGDLYHSHIPSPFFAKAIIKKKYKPHIITYHNDVTLPKKVNGKYIPNFFGKWIVKKNLKIIDPILDDANYIIATTKSYAKTSPVLSRYLNKVKIIPNGIDANKFLPNIDAGERDKKVLYIGRLVEYKGLSILLEAMKYVQKEINSKLIVIGDGSDRKRFEKLAKELKVNVDFKGKVSGNILKKLIQNSRVLVLPSQSRLEAFGIVLLEAMACKTPVIGSEIPGVNEIAREGGLTFKNKNELSRKIIKILTNDQLATKLGKKGRKNVEKKYDWQIVINKIEKLYNEFI
jgi:glycosyltransferase involved in cell wall biosynthesis